MKTTNLTSVAIAVLLGTVMLAGAGCTNSKTNQETSEEQFKTFKPSICNRLDRNTSGLLIAGKTLKGLQTMAEALKKRTVQKYYRCIVKGDHAAEHEKENAMAYHPAFPWNDSVFRSWNI